MHAEIDGRHGERTARPGRGFFKQQRHVLPFTDSMRDALLLLTLEGGR